MIPLQQRTDAFRKLGNQLHTMLQQPVAMHGDGNPAGQLETIVMQAGNRNGWFVPSQVRHAISGISVMLEGEHLEKWTARYPSLSDPREPRKVTVIMAGNIPLVNFHDFLCVLMAGHAFCGKLSSSDPVLLPWITDLLCSIEPRFQPIISFTEGLVTATDEIIATGSDNSSRYFEYYFSKYPNVIRKNRNSAAVLTGNETDEDFKKLGDDVFSYFGLGCRNVAHVFLPEGYPLTRLAEKLVAPAEIIGNHKYFNNYEYRKAILMVNGDTFYDNGTVLMKQDPGLAAPIGVLHYSFYSDPEALAGLLKQSEEKIQCIAAEGDAFPFSVPFGSTQLPGLHDYPDRTDVMDFLLKLS